MTQRWYSVSSFDDSLIPRDAVWTLTTTVPLIPREGFKWETVSRRIAKAPAEEADTTRHEGVFVHRAERCEAHFLEASMSKIKNIVKRKLEPTEFEDLASHPRRSITEEVSEKQQITFFMGDELFELSVFLRKGIAALPDVVLRVPHGCTAIPAWIVIECEITPNSPHYL
jgi:hypothetical protein